jgi:hypothetical protein
LVVGSTLLYDGSWSREFGSEVLCGCAAVANIGNKHVGKSFEGALVTGSTTDLDRSAVHVQLRGSRHLREPGPGKGGLAVGNAVRQLKVVLVHGAVNTRATSLDGLDDLEDRILSRFCVHSDRQLARATTMDSCTLEFDSLLFPNSHGVHLGHTESKVRLAWKLRLGDGAVVNLVDTVWDRRLHDDMGVD